MSEGTGFPGKGWPSLPIRTRRLLLRTPRPRDVDAIWSACTHPSTRRGVHLLPFPYRRTDAIRFVNTKQRQFRKKESLALAMVRPRPEVFVGMIELMPRSAHDRCAELGYWVAPGQRRNGYATEAARVVCAVGFETLHLHRVEARALARNHASIRVLEKAGFRHEGVFRKRARIGSRWLDEVRLARVAPP
jgi:RimJ/RimL family protein N-acetyltransferase